jgi:beta-galactosidase/beta-glucuronidase
MGPILADYPRPQMVRNTSTYHNLNGLWELKGCSSHADSSAKVNDPPACTIRSDDPPFNTTLPDTILVPFPVESCLSGVGEVSDEMWYRRIFDVPADWEGSNKLLHFGAVDWNASVYVNGAHVGSHIGGYDKFNFDVTSVLKETNNEVLVYVFDPSSFGGQPAGKQNFFNINDPGGDHYTSTSGIWGTVWLEQVPKQHITSLQIDANMQEINLTVFASADADTPFYATVFDATGKAIVSAHGKITRSSNSMPTALTIDIPPPRHLWSPDSPSLYKLKIRLGGNEVDSDSVDSYFGLRSFTLGSINGTVRPLLNGEFVFMMGWLDQSWWPDGQYTAPSDQALRSDLIAAKTYGMNTIRLHQKVNSDRWYFHADTLGLLVIQVRGGGWRNLYFM